MQTLDLGRNGFTELPGYWTLPANLTELYLDYLVNMTGPLPGTWVLPERLRLLYLQNTKFTGSIPQSWKLPNSLKELNLAGCGAPFLTTGPQRNA